MRLLLGMAVAVFCLAACSPRDVVDETYADLAEATSKRAIREGGWLPSFLPPSSSNIRLRYNIDTNEVWASLNWDGANRGSLDESCKRAEMSQAQFPQRAPSWWPQEMTRDAAKKPTAAEMEILECADRGLVALHRDQKRAYYWSNG